MPSFNDLLLLQAAFGSFVSYNFVFSPNALFEGVEGIGVSGFGRYAIESFGLSDLVYSLTVVVMRGDTKFQAVNVGYNLFWMAHLGCTYLTGGAGWREASSLSDGNFAIVPCVAHGIFATISALAYLRSSSSASAKSPTKGD
jgi:hypothetical protein